MGWRFSIQNPTLRIQVITSLGRDYPDPFLFFSDGIGTQKILLDREGSDGFLAARHPNAEREDRCERTPKNTSPEVRLLRVPNTHSPGMTGGWLGCLWK